MILLTLDVGVTTGYALSIYTHRIINVYTSGNLSVDDLPKSILQSYVTLFLDLKVLAEFPPVQFNGKLGQDLGRASQYIHSLFPNVESVPPGIWKPIADLEPIPVQLSLPILDITEDPLWEFQESQAIHRSSQHQRDAIGIAVWYYHTHKESREGETC
jgi:hypothetical protein